MNTTQIKKLNDLAIIPSKGSPHSAGYDLFSTEDYTLMPLERKLFKTGLSLAIPNGMYGRIAPRSGLAFKDGIDVLAGVIDEDYRGELGVVIINLGKNEKQFKIGDKIAQIIFEFYNNVDFQLVNDLSETQRGTGGFGSTANRVTITEKKIESPAESKNLIDKWISTGASGIPTPQKYESIVKEREKKLTS